MELSPSERNELLEQVIQRYCNADVVEQYKSLQGPSRHIMLDALKAFFSMSIIHPENLRDPFSKQTKTDWFLDFVVRSLGCRLDVDVTKARNLLINWGRKKSKTLHVSKHEHNVEENSKFRMMSKGKISWTNYQTNSVVINTVERCLDMSKLKKTFIKDLKLFETAKDEYIEGIIITNPLMQVGITTFLEDENGDHIQLGLYNMIPNCAERFQLAEMKFPKGIKIKILQPFYKIFTDGNCGVRVDSLEDIIFLSDPDSFDELREKAKTLVKCGDLSAALKLYFSYLPQFEDALSLLNNRSQTNLKLENFEDALLDAAAVLLMDEGNKKAKSRYKFAATRLGYSLLPDKTKNHNLWRQLLDQAKFPFISLSTVEDCTREIGNKAFNDQNYTEANRIYSIALSNVKDLPTLLNNIAVVCLKSEMFHTAISAANTCLRITVNEEHRKKARYSMTKAFFLLGEYELAKLSGENNPAMKSFYKTDNDPFKVIDMLKKSAFGLVTGFNVEFYDKEVTGDYVRTNALEHCYIPGKGRGIKAKADLPMGELLLVDHPVISMAVEDNMESFDIDSNRNRFTIGGSLELRQRLLARIKYDGLLVKKLLLLQPTVQEKKDSPPLPLISNLEWMGYYHLSEDISPFLPQTPSIVDVDRACLTPEFVKNVIHTNVFSWRKSEIASTRNLGGIPQHDMSALALRVSLFNHDYDPNCVHMRIGSVLTIFSRRFISKGEELTILYNPKESMTRWGL